MPAVRKKKLPNRRASGVTARALSDFAEEVRSQLGEARKDFHSRLENLGEQMKQGFDRVDQRFDEIDRRFDKVDRRFDGVEGDIRRLQAASREHGRQLEDIQQTLRKKVDREEVEGIVEQVLARETR